jgi:hypothetical protein
MAREWDNADTFLKKGRRSMTSTRPLSFRRSNKVRGAGSNRPACTWNRAPTIV